MEVEEGRVVMNTHMGAEFSVRDTRDQDLRRDIAVDLAVIAAEGMRPSAAAYLYPDEAVMLAAQLLRAVQMRDPVEDAIDLLARVLMESGQEIGELIEARRAKQIG